MLKFKKEEIEMEVSLKKWIEFICDFAKHDAVSQYYEKYNFIPPWVLEKYYH